MRLTELRISLGLSPTELAKKLGITEDKLLAWENETEPLSEFEKIALARFFKVTPEELMKDEVKTQNAEQKKSKWWRCPICKGKNIQYSTLQKRATVCRILFAICMTILLFLIVSNLNVFGIATEFYAPTENSSVETLGGIDPPPGLGDTNDNSAAGEWMLILSVVCFALKITQHCLEKKIHVQLICEGCLHTWTDDSV